MSKALKQNNKTCKDAVLNDTFAQYSGVLPFYFLFYCGIIALWGVFGNDQAGIVRHEVV